MHTNAGYAALLTFGHCHHSSLPKVYTHTDMSVMSNSVPQNLHYFAYTLQDRGAKYVAQYAYFRFVSRKL